MGLQIQTAEVKSASEPSITTEETQESSLTNQTQESQEQPQQEVQAETQVEAPQQETTQETQQETTNEETNEPSNDEVIDLTTDVALEQLQEELGRPITLEEIRTAMDTANANPFANDEVSQLNKFIQETGRTAQDYYRTQATDYSSMSDIDVVRELYRQADPDMPQDELDAMLDVNYKLGGEDDGYSSKELLAAKAQLRKDAKNARGQFEQIKKDYLTPIQSNSSNQPSETDIAAFKESVVSEGNQLGDFEFEGVDWKFGVADDMRQLAVETVSSMSPQELSYYADENGNINYFEAVAEKAVVQNLDTIVKNAIEHGRDLERESQVKDRKNINIPEQQAPAQTTKTYDQKVVDALRQSMGRSGGLKIQTG